MYRSDSLITKIESAIFIKGHTHRWRMRKNCLRGGPLMVHFAPRSLEIVYVCIDVREWLLG